MTRAEHMQWCKKRALEYLPHDPIQAVTSMLSDLSKHPDTKKLSEGHLATYAMLFASKSASEAEHFINGFAE